MSVSIYLRHQKTSGELAKSGKILPYEIYYIAKKVLSCTISKARIIAKALATKFLVVTMGKQWKCYLGAGGVVY
jgi:hypothetical protein